MFPEAIEKVTLSTLVGKVHKKSGSSSTVMDLKMIGWASWVWMFVKGLEWKVDQGLLSKNWIL
ncbi:hypothetical protein L195_g058861 [Trifolium pratense]|uniref:Uncharacterized protein n=1 Tax=Trifolium pratense TaxID=57577 RepID=A0A2K3JUR3_TRIPR|nr:hypothetical protein L195_g058861 [Trifolium pratense]